MTVTPPERTAELEYVSGVGTWDLEVSTRTFTSRGGTGLGPAISREIVTRLARTVGYDSEPGRTSFWVDLPVIDD